MKKWLGVLAVALVGIGIAGCSTQNSSSSTTVSSASVKKIVKKSKKTSKSNLKIRIGNKTIKAHLNNSSAAKAFKKELPKTMKFRSYGDLPEKVADLGHALSTKGMPKGSEGKKGYIGYWSPDRRIVFYYGDEQYWDGIHLIGKFDSKNYAKVIKNMPENTKAKLQLVK